MQKSATAVITGLDFIVLPLMLSYTKPIFKGFDMIDSLLCVFIIIQMLRRFDIKYTMNTVHPDDMMVTKLDFS